MYFLDYDYDHITSFNEYFSQTFPAFYVFMERKTTEAYRLVFEVISNLGFNIVELMADFEPAIKNAFLDIFPAGIVFGCYFHLAQVLGIYF